MSGKLSIATVHEYTIWKSRTGSEGQKDAQGPHWRKLNVKLSFEASDQPLLLSESIVYRKGLGTL